MSNDLEELVDYSLDDEEVNDHEMASVSNAAEQVPDPEDEPQLPSDAELRLSERVLELEKERDALAVKVQSYQRQYPSHSTTIPAPQPTLQDQIHIPPDLVPVLSLLRQHIHDLTRDNAALRYTFLGSRHDTSALSRMPLDPMSPASSMSTTPVLDSAPEAPAEEGVDLAAVVERVKTLMAENDELGDMVAEAGRVDGAEWLKTWEDAKAVIASLESDLQINVGVVESLRGELEKYKQRFGSLDARQERGDGRERERGERNDRERQNERGDRGGGDRNGGRGGRRDGDRGHQRDNRGGRKDGRQEGRGEQRDTRRDDKPAGISILGRAAENARRAEDDRASKRRR